MKYLIALKDGRVFTRSRRVASKAYHQHRDSVVAVVSYNPHTYEVNSSWSNPRFRAKGPRAAAVLSMRLGTESYRTASHGE